jgi:hypothetical protein
MRPLTRRAFLAGGGAAAALVTVKAAQSLTSAGRTVGTSSGSSGLPGLAGAVGNRLGSPAAPFTQARFQPHLNSDFHVQAGARDVLLPLTAVEALSQRSSSGGALKGQQFSLLFSGPAPALGQETYAFAHPALGNFALFIVPVGLPSKGTQTYQAVINDTTA